MVNGLSIMLAVAGTADCPSGAACGEAVRWGAWGLVALGILFFAVGLMPARLQSLEEEQTGWNRASLVRMLQKRMETEQTGWRRLQWPVLGLFFTGLGLATLLGWR